MVDPGFPEGGANPRIWGENLFVKKMHENERNLTGGEGGGDWGLGWVARPWRPSYPPIEMIEISARFWWLILISEKLNDDSR